MQTPLGTLQNAMGSKRRRSIHPPLGARRPPPGLRENLAHWPASGGKRQKLRSETTYAWLRQRRVNTFRRLVEVVLYVLGTAIGVVAIMSFAFGRNGIAGASRAELSPRSSGGNSTTVPSARFDLAW